jgi:hypothetical protein
MQRYANRTPYPTMYPYLLENRGVVNCYERFRLPVRAQPGWDTAGRPWPQYRGEVYLVGGGTAALAAFSPNAIDVRYDAPHGGLLVLNQNFDRGWDAGTGPTIEHLGLNATSVAPGSGRIRFRYRPRSVALGAVISACGATALLLIAWTTRTGRSQRTGR